MSLVLTRGEAGSRDTKGNVKRSKNSTGPTVDTSKLFSVLESLSILRICDEGTHFLRVKHEISTGRPMHV